MIYSKKLFTKRNKKLSTKGPFTSVPLILPINQLIPIISKSKSILVQSSPVQKRSIREMSKGKE